MGQAEAGRGHRSAGVEIAPPEVAEDAASSKLSTSQVFSTDAEFAEFPVDRKRRGFRSEFSELSVDIRFVWQQYTCLSSYYVPNSAHRVWSLWDMMNKFDASGFLWIIHELEKHACGLSFLKGTGHGGKPPSQDALNGIKKHLKITELFFEKLKLEDCKQASTEALWGVNQETVDVSSALILVNRLISDILKELDKRHFLEIPQDYKKYIECEKPFGDTVFGAFPSARFDITEAGNCLAFGNYTASCFHLMRASEVGLWEMGRDRQIPLAQSGKIEFSEWGTIISQLEDSVKAIQQWPNSTKKEEAHKFYNTALIEARTFNDGYRRHIAHVRPSFAPIIDKDAEAMLEHVKRFLVTLATRIAEGKYMPLVW